MSTSRWVDLQTAMVAVLLGVVAGAVLIVSPARAALPEPPCTVTPGGDVLTGSPNNDVVCGLGRRHHNGAQWKGSSEGRGRG